MAKRRRKTSQPVPRRPEAPVRSARIDPVTGRPLPPPLAGVTLVAGTAGGAGVGYLAGDIGVGAALGAAGGLVAGLLLDLRRRPKGRWRR